MFSRFEEDLRFESRRLDFGELDTSDVTEHFKDLYGGLMRRTTDVVTTKGK